MASLKEKRTFEAEDGTEFDTKEEAERYEKLKAARVEFERASSAYNRALAESFKTGDGSPFEMGANYYCVHQQYGVEEGMTWESFYPNQITVSDEHRPSLTRRRFNSTTYKDEVSVFYFDAMFRDKRDAQKRILELKRERLGWLQESVAELEKELGIEPPA